MATQDFINECKNRANADRLGRFNLQATGNNGLQINGETSQKTTRGLQLIKKQAYSTPTSDTAFWNNATYTTPLEDGWAKVERDNTSGSSQVYVNHYISNNAIDYEADTNYTIIFEWRKAKGYSSCNLSQASAAQNPFITNVVINSIEESGTTKQLVKTITTLPSNYVGLRTYFSLPAGTLGSIEVRAMIVKGDYTNQDVDFEYYSGEIPSPNSDYPQVINNITGLQKISIGELNYEINLGKNLIYNKNQQQSREEMGIQYTFNQDGTIDVSGTATGNYNMYLMNGDNKLILPAGTYTLSGGINSYAWIRLQSGSTYIDTSSSQPSKTFTITETTNFNVLLRIKNGESVDGVFKPQLEKGSQATSYSPYFEPIELNKIGNYEDSIKKSTGKNLFDINGTFTGNLIKYNNGFQLIKNSTNRTLNYLPESPIQAGTYTLSYEIVSSTLSDANKLLIQFFNANNTNILTKALSSTGSLNCILNEDVVKIYFYINNNEETDTQITLDNIQLEQNNQATNYEPYGKVWYITKNIGKVVLDGSESGWSYNDVNQVFAVSDLVNYLRSGFIPYSNYYQGQSVTLYSQMESNHIAFLQSTTQNRLLIKNLNYTGVTAFKTWLSTHNTEVDYVLATPTYEIITNEELIEQLDTAKFEVNQSNYLKSITLKDSCYVNDTIIGSIFTKSATVELLNLPINAELVGTIINPEIGVKYDNNTTEYITFDDYTIESLNDEQTASNTGFIAMNGGTLLEEEYKCSLSFDNGVTHTINEFYQDACNQLGLTPTDATFTNSEIAMTGNPFTNKEALRVVLEEVERVSCSIIELDWNKKTITLTWLSNQIDYEFNTSDYSTLEGSLTKYGPLNTIIVGNSQADGENVTMIDAESVELNGEHQIMIDAPYFLYTNNLRTQAIEAIYNKLDGLTYYDLKLTTPYGKPFLKIGNKIRINTNENQVYDTYVLTHTFTFNGAFQSVIESPALTSEEQTIKNEYKGKSIREQIKRTEFIVNKVTGDISAITEKVTTVEDAVGNTYTKEETNTLIQNAASGITNTFTAIGGNNILRNTGLWAKDETSGKNMFNNQDVETGYLNSTGIIGEAPAYRVSNYISVEPNKNYTYQGTTIDTFYGSKIGYYNSYKNWVGYEDIVANGTTITIPDGVYFFRTTVRESELNTYQLEEGTTATTYEPFYHPYEFWIGKVERISEDKASNNNALLLQNDTLTQQVEVKNGTYTLSFKYKKLINLADCKLVVNDMETPLTSLEDTEIIQQIEVSSRNITISFITDTANSCEVYDLMLNIGEDKSEYAQNQNETTTDTVNIGKGITITSSDTETVFKANSDGVRIFDNKDLDNPRTKFTNKGTETDYIEVKNEANILGLYHKKVGNHIWVTKL